MILLEKNVPLYYEVSVAAMLLQLSFTPMHCRIAQQVTVAGLVQCCRKISRCFCLLNPWNLIELCQNILQDVSCLHLHPEKANICE